MLPSVGHIIRLAAIIREVDGTHSLGAAALAEAILSHPQIEMVPALAPAPTKEEVAELIKVATDDAECIAAEQPDLMSITDTQLRRIAELLQRLPSE
jgi:hypothetical protein